MTAKRRWGRWTSSRPIFHRHRDGPSRGVGARLTIGRIAWSVGEIDVAVPCLERARRIDPFAPVGDLVALLTSLGRDDDAHAWLAKIDSRPGEAAGTDRLLRARANVASEPAGFTRSPLSPCGQASSWCRRPS